MRSTAPADINPKPPLVAHMQDPGVMSASLCALYEVVKQDPRPYKNLIPSFTSILKQVSLECIYWQVTGVSCDKAAAMLKAPAY
jgi:hypothetical protein